MGDSCRFLLDDGSESLAKLIEFTSMDKKSKDFGKVKIQWYYRKNEINYAKLKISDF